MFRVRNIIAAFEKFVPDRIEPSRAAIASVRPVLGAWDAAWREMSDLPSLKAAVAIDKEVKLASENQSVNSPLGAASRKRRNALVCCNAA